MCATMNARRVGDESRREIELLKERRECKEIAVREACALRSQEFGTSNSSCQPRPRNLSPYARRKIRFDAINVNVAGLHRTSRKIARPTSQSRLPGPTPKVQSTGFMI